MKTLIIIVAGAAAVAGIAGWACLGNNRSATRASGEKILTPPPGRTSTAPSEPAKLARPADAAQENAKALLNQLAKLSVPEGNPRAARSVLVLLEQLARMGPKALPAVGQFLTSGHDVLYAAPAGKRLRDVKSLVKATVPPSLRMALFDLVAQLGGKEAEAILSASLSSTQSGLEVAYLSELLQQIAPGSYQSAVVAAATKLLDQGTGADRNILFEMIRGLGDTSYVASAQRQMFQPDGQLDRGALRYLQQAMGPQSLNLAVRTYQDPRLVEPGSKEPLARIALTYVGGDTQALELFHTAILDPSLLPDQKSNLVEDLNEEGLTNQKVPTPEDLQLIAKRYELTQAYLQETYVLNDETLHAAFVEADKDLHRMLEKAAGAPQ